jgi:hypothetical protein
MLNNKAAMPEEFSLFESLLEKFGIGGIALALAWALFRQLSQQYERRINALEQSSRACEVDRVKIRDELVKLQNRVIDMIRHRDDEA